MWEVGLNKLSRSSDGLWPDYNDGTWPACCSGSQFDMNEISTLHKTLKKYWPSFSCGASSTCHHGKGSFWAHEWEKHGTCSYPVVHDEYEYFQTTLIAYFKYNVTGVLFEAGYVPSNSEKYPLGGIISAIQNAFHATPELICSGDAVEELRICFYKDFQPRDCASGSIIRSDTVSSRSCPWYVSLPVHGSGGNKQVAGFSFKLCFAVHLLLIFAFIWEEGFDNHTTAVIWAIHLQQFPMVQVRSWFDQVNLTRVVRSDPHCFVRMFRTHLAIYKSYTFFLWRLWDDVV